VKNIYGAVNSKHHEHRNLLRNKKYSRTLQQALKGLVEVAIKCKPTKCCSQSWHRQLTGHLHILRTRGNYTTPNYL